jgi:hypothetical protein
VIIDQHLNSLKVCTPFVSTRGHVDGFLLALSPYNTMAKGKKKEEEIALEKVIEPEESGHPR